MKTIMSRLGLVPLIAVFALSLTSCEDATSQGEDTAEAANNDNAATADESAGEATPVAEVVEIEKGRIRGERTEEEADTWIFRGVPYARPPVDDLRWKAPQPAHPWSGVRHALEWSDRCPQPDSQMGDTSTEISEDCLRLNVVTPAENSDEKLPVMVFFHGGGLTTGTGNSPLYNNSALADKGVVTVTVNSRLGPIGYMAHPDLTAESEQGSSGNYGTLDLIASLEWVQTNIEAFGGDPDNVLIFGESGGGTKTLSLISSPLADGLFHKAIVESGSASASPERVTTLNSAEETGQQIAEELDADDAESLRNASWEDLVEAASAEQVGFRANIVVDGWALPESVHDLLQEGKQHDVPLIVGANEGERRELEESVPRLAGLMSDTASSDVFVYNFSHMPTGWREMGCVAFHGIELPYVFGYVPEGLTVPTILYLGNRSGCESDEPGPDEMDQVVADNIMSLWASFAKDSDPSVDGSVDWPTYSRDNGRYLDIGHELEVKENIDEAYVPMDEG